MNKEELIEQLEYLYMQAATERSHYYTARVIRNTIAYLKDSHNKDAKDTE